MADMHYGWTNSGWWVVKGETPIVQVTVEGSRSERPWSGLRADVLQPTAWDLWMLAELGIRWP